MTSSGFCVSIIASDEGFERLARACKPNEVLRSSLGDCISSSRSERPDLLFLELHSSWSLQDCEYALEVLSELKQDSHLSTKVIIYLASPRIAHFLGTLLMAPESMSGSRPCGVIDSVVLSAPLGTYHEQTLENQISATLELLQTSASTYSLPSLGDPAWALTLCDPISVELWCKWLPRYASYTRENPLIVGETGTGKTSLAAALHLLSGRSGPFVTITPRDFSSPELVQAELFGAVAGAYTGAIDKWGLVKKAEGGTLFIDELQSIDVELQGKLITFIENKKYRRVGAAEEYSADVRFVFATNKPLEELVANGNLRDDFAYRLERLQLRIAPLRERRLDILAGASRGLALIHRVRPEHQQFVEGFSEEAWYRLFVAPWPGNLRQLENVVAQCVERAAAEGRRLISEHDVRESLGQSLGGFLPTNSDILSRALEHVKKELSQTASMSASSASSLLLSSAREFALESCGGDASLAARLLGEDEELLHWLHSIQER